MPRKLKAAYDNDEAICQIVREMVPTYHPQQAGQKDVTYEELRREAVCAR